MKSIVDVQICTEKDDVLLTAAGGQCIRFPVSDVRVFQGRTSMGVRGIALEEGDKLISLSILHHIDVTAEERSAYLKRASAVRRGEPGDDETAEVEETNGGIELGAQRYVELSAAEQFVLTISEHGFGKRSSSYRIPRHRPRRQRHHRHGDHRQERPAGRLVPGRGIRPDHAGHRRRPIDPLPDQRHPHRRPLDPGRDRVQYR